MKNILNITINIIIGILVFIVSEVLLCLLWWNDPITLWKESFWLRLWSFLFAYSTITKAVKKLSRKNK